MYSHSVYFLTVDCDKKTVKIYGLSHIRSTGKEIEFIKAPEKKTLTMPEKEIIQSNICRFVKYPNLFDDKSLVHFK